MITYDNREIIENTLELDCILELISATGNISKILDTTRHCNRDTMHLKIILKDLDKILGYNLKEVKK